MSKKHFTKLAARLATIKNLEARRQAAEAVAEVAAETNGQFDRARFMAACGLEAA